MIRRLALCCLLFQSTAFSQTFQEYCEKMGSLPEAQQIFVQAVLESTRADCDTAQGEVSKTGVLHLFHSELSDISLLTSLSGIRHLYLFGNDVTDISVLAELKDLEILQVGHNNISDASPLAGLTDLTVLSLSKNSIRDITPLRDLTNLQVLTLTGNGITDYSSLEKLVKLRYLAVGDSRYSEDSHCPETARNSDADAAADSLNKVLKNFNTLESFSSHSVNFKSLKILESHKNIRSLKVSCASIEETRAFEAWKWLDNLNLDHNRIAKIVPPSSKWKMGSISLSHNFIADASFLKKIVGLKQLNLSYNNLSGEFKLRGQPELYRLNLANNHFKYIDLDGRFPKLTTLDVSNNRIAYLRFDNEDRSLSSFDASGNQLKKPWAAIDLRGVYELKLHNNLISDFSFLEDLTPVGVNSPTELSLGGNLSNDFSMISNRSVLTFDAVGSGLSDIDKLPQMPQLRTLNIAHNKFPTLEGLANKYHNLGQINVSDNPLRGGEGLPDSLLYLDISRTKVRDISFATIFSRLVQFHASGIRLSDLSPLKGLEHLMALDVSHNSIEDLSAVSGQWPIMRQFNLQGNRILDASPLGTFASLRASEGLNLSQNPLGTTVAKTSENCPTQSASSALNAWCSSK